MGVRQSFVVVAMLQVASMGLADHASAQTSACDRLKATLASRIDPSLGNYTLEAVPAGEAVTGGGKVIGTCEGGARKLVLRRGAALQAPTDAAAVAPSASGPAVGAAPVESGRRSRELLRERAAPPMAPVASRPSTDAAAPLPVAAPRVEQEKPPEADATRVEVTRAAETEVQPQEPVQTTSAAGFVGRFGHWILGASLLVLAAWLWARLSYRRAYDEAGLPRGPKLN